VSLLLFAKLIVSYHVFVLYLVGKNVQIHRSHIDLVILTYVYAVTLKKTLNAAKL